MTCHLGAQHRTWAVILAALWLIACGSSGSNRASIELLAPEDKVELTIEDDQNSDLPGVQFEVRAQTKNIKPKTVMLLVIPGENNTAYFTQVDDEGLAVFENATLPPGAHTFTINTANSSVSSDEFSYTLKTLVIETPKDGSSVSFGSDTDKEKDGLQVVVNVKAYAVDGKDDITLTVDGERQGDAVSPDADGEATFEGITLATGTRILRATSGDLDSADVKVSVNEACASVTFLTPEVPADADRVSLGGGDGCPAVGDDFVADFVVSTDANEGSDAELTVNNTTKQRAKVSGALVKFEGVILNRRMTANEVTVTVQGAGGVTCDPVPYPKEIFVDCDGSDCSIGSPVPYSGEASNGDPAFYLNKSMMTGDGFDIRVDSDSGVIGKSLQLIIDGRDGRNALSSEAVPNGSRLSATFSSVKLANGTHTVEGRCTDESGNVTESGALTWVVDTDVCGVSLAEPAANALIVPGNDADSNASNGIMLAVKASVTGSDCNESRTAICNPSTGITDGDFSTIVNGAVDTQVTLTSGADQQVCVEARDRANNIGRASAAVKYRSTVPLVEIETPTNDTKFNAAGSADPAITADSAPNSPACNADFRVACTELGGTVQLHRVDENGPVVASGPCAAQADGDPAIPSGFAGRAKLDDVAFLGPGADNVAIVATQTVAGSSDQSLVGKSAPLMLTGWCQRPEIVLRPNCPPAQIEVNLSGTTVDVSAVYNGPVPARAPEQGSALVTAVSDGSQVSSSTADINGSNTYPFTDVGLGMSPVALNLALDFTDDYLNKTTLTCPITLVSDLPELTIESPADGAKLGPAGACTPSPAAPDRYGVPLEITLDQTGMRTLGYRIDNGALVPLTITGTSMTPCIPVTDGSHTISVELASMVAQGGTAKPSVTVDVSMLTITAPADGAALLPVSDCDAGSGFGVTVTATVSPILEGLAYTAAGVQAVQGTVISGLISACVPLNTGANVITLTIDGKNISRTVDVAVVGGAPTHAIPISTVNIPPNDGTFRSAQVTLGWATPEQDYTGQLKAYELRCSASAIAASPDQTAQDAWWAGARPVALANNATPPGTSSTAAIRAGENLYCALRGRDAADQLSPISETRQVNYSFRERAIDGPELNRMGYALASVGDVNDDGVNDVLIGGTGRAYLLFGGPTASAKTAPDVTFVGSSGLPNYEFGTRVAGLGDINGDGTNDFAIAHPSHTLATPTSVGSVGAVYVFYGRKQSDAWPTVPIDLSGSSGTECGADVCFYGDQEGEQLGFALAPAGKFDADNLSDIAISAASRDFFNGRQYVLMGRAFEGAGSRPATGFWNVPIRLPSGDPIGFYVDGNIDTGTDATTFETLGQSVVPVGNRDGVAGDDLLITALGFDQSAKLALLSGRANDGTGTRLRELALDQLAIKDTGAAESYGLRAAAFRNYYGAGDAPDVAVFQGFQNLFYLYLGEDVGGTFSNSARITFSGGPAETIGNGGLSISTGYNPSIDEPLSDIDGDGIDDICAGIAPGGTPAKVPVYVFYGADTATSVNANAASYTSAAQLNPTLRPGTDWRSVQPVGDITGDGHADIIIGEPNGNSNQGGITILY